MTRLGWRVRWAVWLRALAIQASWNYRTLLGTGFAFALVPVLRVLCHGEPEKLRSALERHRGLFNSHPYLAPMALGAVAALETEGEDAALIERFKTAVRGSLGTLGDRLVWAGWRPVCLLLAVALLLTGAPWWLGVAAFLVVYNAGHLWLRCWSYVLGWREGKRVGERMRHSTVGELHRAMGIVGAFLVGLILPFAATGGLVGVSLSPAWIGLGVVAAAAGIRYGAAARTPVVIGLGAFTLIGIFLRVLP